MFDYSSDIAIVMNDAGTPATIKEAGHADKLVTVIFDQNSLNEMGVLTDKPQAALAAADLAGTDLKAATITISSTVYKMTRPMPDGAGMTTVLLARS